MSRPTFYSDMGPGIELRDDQGVVTALPRYGVWKWNPSKRKHEVAEVGDDLQALRDKHGEGQLVDMQPPQAGQAVQPAGQ